MPELPDLHVFSLNLKKRILHKNIASVNVYNTRTISTPGVFCEQLTGTAIRDIVREGKELHFLLENNDEPRRRAAGYRRSPEELHSGLKPLSTNNSFGVHLMLSGKFSLCNRDETEKINAKIAALFFEDGEAFVISDFQHLCKVVLNPVPSQTPDALSPAFTFEYFSDQIKRKARENIKAVLIDQRVVRGIGNAYVDEILWEANISPESVSGKIPEERLKQLFQAVPVVLNDAILNIQSISPDIISGEERGFLKVHNPRRKNTDDGGKITVKTVAGKKTYFSEKQELFR